MSFTTLQVLVIELVMGFMKYFISHKYETRNKKIKKLGGECFKPKYLKTCYYLKNQTDLNSK